MQAYLNLTKNRHLISTNYIFSKCKTSLKWSKILEYATPDYIQTNKPLWYVTMLSQLEERLLTLRIIFSQIWQLGYKKSQIGSIGSIKNVLVDIDVIQTTLPCSTDETSTIVIALKRQLEYKNTYQTRMICTSIIMKFLK